jgi:hypothetical protein
MIIEDNKIFYYGKVVGSIENGIAYVKKDFQSVETETGLFIKGYKVIWITN